MPKNPKVFLDIVIGGSAAGRIIIELFKDLTPYTAQNFRALCSGDYQQTEQGVQISLLDTLFYTVVKNRYCLGGDMKFNTGKGGNSIYGEYFADQNFSRRHAHAGLLSMVSKGPNTNNSNFMITFGACPDLDGKQVVFGQVVDGMKVVRAIQSVQTDTRDRPTVQISIFKCGQLSDDRDHIKFQEFSEQIKYYRGVMNKKSQIRQKHLQQYQHPLQEISVQNAPEQAQSESYSQQERDYSAVNQKLRAVKMRLKQARELNQIEVHKAQLKPKENEWKEKKKRLFEKLQILGIPENKSYLLDNVSYAQNLEKMKRKKEKRNAFGWESFNSDALLRNYKRRVKKLEFDKETYDKQINGIPFVPSPDKIQRMVQELKEQQSRRKKFSRRRPFYQDIDVSYINQRNRAYNLKLARNFKEQAAEIKGNLDRGTNI